MLAIDVRLILIGSTAFVAVSAGVIALVWYQGRARHPELLLWVLSFALITLTFVLMSERGMAPDWASIVLAQTCFISSQIALYEGIARYVGVKVQQWHNFVLLAGVVLAVAYWGIVNPDFSVRAVAIGVVSALIMGQAAWLTAKRIPPDLQIAARPASIMLTVIAFFGLLSAVTTFRHESANSLRFMQSEFGGGQVIIIEILQVMLSFALLLFVNRRLLLEAEQEVNEKTAVAQELEESRERLEAILMSVTKAMGGIVDARDPYTQGHQLRVAHIARLIAEEMDMDPDDVEGLEVAALMHDIGQLAIPAEILTRPGKLSPVEFTLVKEHPRAGYEILKNIEFRWPVADIVLQHHERLDGSGYPDCLANGDLLLQSRILMVADVLEAMSSHRPYRPALGIEAAMDEITGHPEKYDAYVTAACVRLNESGAFAR